MECKVRTKKCKVCGDKFKTKFNRDICSGACLYDFNGKNFREHKKKKKENGLKRYKLKRTPIKKVGKVGKRNINANKILKKLYQKENIVLCELRFDGCKVGTFLSWHHKHKREWYRPKGKQKFLYSLKHTILCCVNCHEILEESKEKSDKAFDLLRP